jgi:hypothetical protein
MNPIALYGSGLLTVLALLVVPKVWAATENVDTRASVAESHASLKAYPNAVITLKDPKTENLFYVESNGRRMVAFKKDGTVMWSVDMLDAIKVTPRIGQPVIRHLKLDEDRILVTIAKHDHAEIQTTSGTTKYLGAD